MRKDEVVRLFCQSLLSSFSHKADGFAVHESASAILLVPDSAVLSRTNNGVALFDDLTKITTVESLVSRRTFRVYGLTQVEHIDFDDDGNVLR